jgi:hypothetical protein
MPSLHTSLLLFHYYYARYDEMSNTGVDDEAEREMEDMFLTISIKF